jgi:hypothetical protein
MFAYTSALRTPSMRKPFSHVSSGMSFQVRTLMKSFFTIVYTVCSVICRIKLLRTKNFSLQTPHLKRLSPQCIPRCRFKKEQRMNLLLLTLHENCRSLVCTSICKPSLEVWTFSYRICMKNVFLHCVLWDAFPNSSADGTFSGNLICVFRLDLWVNFFSHVLQE